MSRSVLVSGGRSGLHQEISIGPHRLQADEPSGWGGDDAGPNPYELVLAGLGACTSMTLRMYADRKQWPLESVEVRLAVSRIHAEDCAKCDTEERFAHRIEREIALLGDLSEEQRARLLEIANRCPVHRMLTSRIEIETRLSDETFGRNTMTGADSAR